MKTTVNQSIVKSSQRFLNNVAEKLPQGISNFNITSFGMQRASGYRSYNYVMEVEIDEEYVTLKKHTNDSVDFDNYTDLEYKSHNFNNWTKRRVLSMLSENTIFYQILKITKIHE